MFSGSDGAIDSVQCGWKLFRSLEILDEKCLSVKSETWRSRVFLSLRGLTLASTSLVERKRHCDFWNQITKTGVGLKASRRSSDLSWEKPDSSRGSVCVKAPGDSHNWAQREATDGPSLECALLEAQPNCLQETAWQAVTDCDRLRHQGATAQQSLSQVSNLQICEQNKVVIGLHNEVLG